VRLVVARREQVQARMPQKPDQTLQADSLVRRHQRSQQQQ
jgi:hypothetical protein